MSIERSGIIKFEANVKMSKVCGHKITPIAQVTETTPAQKAPSCKNQHKVLYEDGEVCIVGLNPV